MLTRLREAPRCTFPDFISMLLDGRDDQTTQNAAFPYHAAIEKLTRLLMRMC